MKSLVYTGARSLEYRDSPPPKPDEGEVLVEVASVGICGSDMHAYLGHDERRPAPLILGHEAAGTVVSGPTTGQRVTVNPLVSCTKCPNCKAGRENLCASRQILSMPPREGAFAQFVAVPERNLVAIPDNVDFDKAALAEPIACGWHAARIADRLSVTPLAQANALVIGGGAIGVGAALALFAIGINNVKLVEPNQNRAKILENKIGLEAFPPDSLPADDPIDLVIDAVGLSSSRMQASELVRPGGLIVHIGLGEATGGLDIRRMTLQEVTFIGTYTYTMSDFQQTAQAIFESKLGQLDWIESRPLEEGAAAFADLLGGTVDTPKIILKPRQG